MTIERNMRVQVRLSGIGSGIMFDRYGGSNDSASAVPVEKKMYFAGGDPEASSGAIVLPADNLMSFLCAQNTASAPKILLPMKTYKSFAAAIASFVSVDQSEVAFTRNGEPIVFSGFNGGLKCSGSGIIRHMSVARLPKGIPNPKERPLLRCPWDLDFTISVVANRALSMGALEDLFREGGRRVCLGTFRPRYGQFTVSKWEASVIK